MTPKDKESPAPATQAVHAGEDVAFWGEAIVPAIAQTSTYTFASVADLKRFKRGEQPHAEYGRYGNPTVAVVERKLAALEGAEAALLVGSGMAAISLTLLTVLRAGAHVVLTADHYGGTRALLDLVLPRFGLTYTIVPVDDPAAWAAALRPESSLLFTEVPTNPHLRVPDVDALAQFARQHRLTFVVDATLASPLLHQPLRHGADLVVHSATKYLGGHNDLLAGVVAGAAPMVEAVRQTNHWVGAVPAPMDAYLLNRGLKTLALRMPRHSESAAWLAERLARDPRVAAVFYPGLGADGAVAARLLPRGRGGVLSLRPHGGDAAAERMLDALRLFRHGGSLGGAESLAQIHWLFTMFELPPSEVRARGLETDLIRLSVGLEDPADLWADLDAALDAAAS